MGVYTVCGFAGNQYFATMIIAIIATLIALVTAIIAVIAAQEVITDPEKLGWNKLNTKGYVVIVCGLLMSALPFSQWSFQNQLDEQKEIDHKKEQDRRDSLQLSRYGDSIRQIRKDYEVSVIHMSNEFSSSVDTQRSEYASSVKHIRKDFSDKNNQTLTVIGQTLGSYGLRLDTTEKRLRKMIQDSANIKTVLPNAPVLAVIKMEDNIPALTFLKVENNENHYRIKFVSQDGASCCYDLKMSAVIVDSGDITGPYQMAYKGLVPMYLTADDNIAANASVAWTFTINNSNHYDRLFLWVRGTYMDRNGTHVYSIDKVYYNLKSSNISDEMGEATKKGVIKLVRRFEKN
jgi:hypothetical protein